MEICLKIENIDFMETNEFHEFAQQIETIKENGIFTLFIRILDKE